MIIDTKTWGLNSRVGVSLGSLRDPWITNFDTGEAYGEADLPVKILPGTRISGMCYGDNISGVIRRMNLIIEFIDPDGVSRGTAEHGFSYVSPVGYLLQHTGIIILDKAGIWQLHAVLED